MFTEYYEAGYSVIPIITKTAAPFEKDWARWAKERQPAELIEEYERKYKLPLNGIGLVCGEMSGIIALDIDSESPDILNLCPPSPVRKRGSKGETRFYRYSSGIRCINRKRKNIGPNKDKEEFEGIEILSDGRQTVMPPSINRKTNLPYLYVTPDTLLDLKPDELPELLQAEVNRMAEYIDTFGKESTTAGRNDQLTRVICAMIHQSPHKSDEQLAQELLAYDLRQHTRPYFGDKDEPECKSARGNMLVAATRFVIRHRRQILEKAPLVRVGNNTDWESLGLRCNKSGPIPNYDTMMRVISGVPELAQAFWYDSFLGNILTTWDGASPRPYHSVDAQSVLQYTQSIIGVPYMQRSNVEDAIVAHARRNQRNEVKEWLEALPPHDGLFRLATFFPAYLGSENSPYHEAIGENLFTGLVARIMEPGCKAENMVILEGKQGIMKSTALKAIVGERWFGELLSDLGSKDALMSIQGKWLIEVPELDAFVKAEATTIKSVLSVQVDTFRAPYGRTIERFPRQNLFVGTTNATGYLKDQTGGRRFWPVQCTSIDVAKISQDREQLFAEALLRYRAGERWHSVPEETAREHVDMRTEQDPWENHIIEWLNDPTRKGAEITTSWLLHSALDIPKWQIHPGYQRRMSQILVKNGYVLQRVKNTRIYVKV